MPVTAKLSRRFYDTFGDEIATEFVEWFNQVDATYRADLKELNDLNFARFDAKVGQRFAESDAKWEARFSAFENKWEARWTKDFADFPGAGHPPVRPRRHPDGRAEVGGPLRDAHPDPLDGGTLGHRGTGDSRALPPVALPTSRGRCRRRRNQGG